MNQPASPPANRRRLARRLARLGLAVVLVGAAAWVVVGQVRTRAHLTRGIDALGRDDPAAARDHLARYLEARPDSGEGHLLAARAARRCGDLPAAAAHLKEAERLHAPDGDVRLERAALTVQAGGGGEAEGFLLEVLAAGHPESPQILAVLVPAYAAQFRMVEAGALARRWVELRPESAAALRHHADILERLRKQGEATDALRKLVTLDPGDPAARANLVRLLLETHQAADEAAGHAEWLCRADPGNPAHQSLLAACREAQGRPDEAAAILDRVLAAAGADAKAYHTRGRLEMTRGRAADALPFLRRSVELDRSDPEALYTLFQCLQQAGTPDEAREAEQRWKKCDADLRRVGELGRAIATTPFDPDPRREIGELFLRNGREADGVRWLESALRLKPDHAPTHRVLADHYERTGKPDPARFHRSFTDPPGGKP